MNIITTFFLGITIKVFVTFLTESPTSNEDLTFLSNNIFINFKNFINVSFPIIIPIRNNSITKVDKIQDRNNIESKRENVTDKIN